MSVGRICCREVDLAAADESVLGAARRMGREGVGTLVVLGEDRRPIGLLTDRDVILTLLAEEFAHIGGLLKRQGA